MIKAKYRVNGNTVYDKFEYATLPDEEKAGVYEVRLCLGYYSANIIVRVLKKNIDAFLDDLENCIEMGDILYLVEDDVIVERRTEDDEVVG